MHSEPPGAQAREPSQLATVDGLGRGHERSGAPCLHFDEHVAVAVAAHEIDLTETGPLISRDDPEAAPHELELSRAFSREPQGTPIHA